MSEIIYLIKSNDNLSMSTTTNDCKGMIFDLKFVTKHQESGKTTLSQALSNIPSAEFVFIFHWYMSELK